MVYDHEERILKLGFLGVGRWLETQLEIIYKLSIYQYHTSNGDSLASAGLFINLSTFWQCYKWMKLKIVMTWLVKDARVFARVFRDSYSTFDELKAEFLEHIWCEEKQGFLQQRLTNGVYKMPRGLLHMTSYFLRSIAKLADICPIRATRTLVMREYARSQIP
jgi:hypothetical protein